jgi:hypothetical protein
MPGRLGRVLLVASAIWIFPNVFHKKFELDFRNSSSQNPFQTVDDDSLPSMRDSPTAKESRSARGFHSLT